MKRIPHYLPEVLKKHAETKPGRIYHTTIRHDSWCDQLNNRGPCNCNPEVGDPVEEQ